MAKNIPPSIDNQGSLAAVTPMDCQFELPARKERTITPVSWVVLVTLAIPAALQSNVKMVLVKTDGSTWQ